MLTGFKCWILGNFPHTLLIAKIKRRWKFDSGSWSRDTINSKTFFGITINIIYGFEPSQSELRGPWTVGKPQITWAETSVRRSSSGMNRPYKFWFENNLQVNIILAHEPDFTTAIGFAIPSWSADGPVQLAIWSCTFIIVQFQWAAIRVMGNWFACLSVVPWCLATC